MPNASKKLFLEMYGLARITLGLAQIVGLFSAFFLKEIVVRYPAPSTLYILNQDLVALTYLIVLLRGLFHLLAGIGLARVRLWTRWVLGWGWPLVAALTFGLVYSFYQDWAAEGYVTHLGEIIHGPWLLFYSCFILFDIFFIGRQLRIVNQEGMRSGESSEAMDGKDLVVFCGLVTFFFIGLLFFGRPLKQGFHKGFYKVKDKKDPVVSSQFSRKETFSSPREDKNIGREKEKASSAIDVKQVFSERKGPTPRLVLLETEASSATKKSSSPEAPAFSWKQGVAYQMMIGLAAGLFILGGFLLQLFRYFSDEDAVPPVSSYFSIALGFLLLGVYGISLKAGPLVFSGFTVFLTCLLIGMKKVTR